MSELFKDACLLVLSQVPEGKVVSYGQLAKLAGFPQGARAVGRLLSQLPCDTQLPWHRVVNSKGEISFKQGSDAYQRQRARLEEEGVCFTAHRIDMKRFAWQLIP